LKNKKKDQVKKSHSSEQEKYSSKQGYSNTGKERLWDHHPWRYSELERTRP